MKYMIPLIVLFTGLTPPALAQSQTDALQTPAVQNLPMDSPALRAFDTTALPFYQHMAEIAIRRRPDVFDFNAFRSHYSATPQYDPLGDRVTDLMLRLSLEIKNAPDSKTIQKLQKDYANLIGDHLANIDIVTLAETLAKNDARLGDPDLFLWLRRGIIKSVLESGDGKTLARAYDVITAGEEARLIAALGLENPVREERDSAGLFYTMVGSHDKKSGAPTTIFINTTVPKSFLVSGKPSQDRIFSIAPDKSSPQ